MTYTTLMLALGIGALKTTGTTAPPPTMSGKLIISIPAALEQETGRAVLVEVLQLPVADAGSALVEPDCD